MPTPEIRATFRDLRSMLKRELWTQLGDITVDAVWDETASAFTLAGRHLRLAERALNKVES